MQQSQLQGRPQAITNRTHNMATIQYKSKLPSPNSNKPHSTINLAPVDISRKHSTLHPISPSKLNHINTSHLVLENDSNIYKLNSIRNANNQSKEEIINLKARINKLKEQNQKSRKRSVQSYAEIEKMLSTKYNYIEKKRNRSLQDERKMHEQLERIEATQLARIQNKEATKSSKEKNQEDKSTMGFTQRQIWSLESQALRQDKQKIKQLNAEKARNIKEYEKEHRNYLSIINQLSRVKARSNHQQKMKSYIKQKQILNKTMRILRQEEGALLNELKKESEELKNIEDEIEQMKTRTGRERGLN